MMAHPDRYEILLIDDDEDFRTGLAGVLRDDGFGVLEYAGGHELPMPDALPGIRLIITDYQMPGDSGLAIADRYHAAHPSVPIVLVTAHWSRQLEAEVAARPFIRLCRKPFNYEDIETLLLAIREP